MSKLATGDGGSLSVSMLGKIHELLQKVEWLFVFRPQIKVLQLLQISF